MAGTVTGLYDASNGDIQFRIEGSEADIPTDVVVDMLRFAQQQPGISGAYRSHLKTKVVLFISFKDEDSAGAALDKFMGKYQLVETNS